MRESNFHSPTQNKACVCISSVLYDRRAIDATSPLPLLSTLTHLSYLTSTTPPIRDILCRDGGLERLIRVLLDLGKRMRAQREEARREARALHSVASSAASSSVASSAYGEPDSWSRTTFSSKPKPADEPTRTVKSPFKPFGIAKRELAAQALEQHHNAGGAGGQAVAAYQAVAVGLTTEQKHTLWTWSLAFQCVVNIGVRGSEKVRTRVVEAGVVPIVISVLGGFLQEAEKKRVQAEQWEKEAQRNAHAAASASVSSASASVSSASSSSLSGFASRGASLTSVHGPSAALADSEVPMDPRTPRGATAVTGPTPANQAPPPTHPPLAPPRLAIPSQTARTTIHSAAASSAGPRTPAGSTPVWPRSSASSAQGPNPIAGPSQRPSTAATGAPYVADQTPEGSEEGSQNEDEDEDEDEDAVMEFEAGDAGPSRSAGTSNRRRGRRGTIKATGGAGRDGARIAPRLATEDGDVTMGEEGIEQTPRAGESQLTDEGTDGDAMVVEAGSVPVRSFDFRAPGPETRPAAAPRDAEAAQIWAGDGSPRPLDLPHAATTGPVPIGRRLRRSTIAGSPASSAHSSASMASSVAAAVDAAPTAALPPPPPSPASQLSFRDEDVVSALQLLAYLSKYPHVRAKFHEPADKATLELTYGSTAEAARAVASFAGKVKAERGERERIKEQQRLVKEGRLDKLPFSRLEGQGRDHHHRAGGSGSAPSSTFSSAATDFGARSSAASSSASSSGSSSASIVSINPLSTNVFSFVERFTHRLPGSDKPTAAGSDKDPDPIQYWAGVIMRNACRRDEERGGIRQCANMQCGVWEQFPREFAKCRRCRKAKYCSKACQSKAWQLGHRFWCLIKEDGEPGKEADANASTTTAAATAAAGDSSGNDRRTARGGGPAAPAGAPPSSDRRRQRATGDGSDDEDGEEGVPPPPSANHRSPARHFVMTPDGPVVAAAREGPSGPNEGGRGDDDALRGLGEMNAELVQAAAAAAAGGIGGVDGMLQDDREVARRMLLGMGVEDGVGVIGVDMARNGRQPGR